MLTEELRDRDMLEHLEAPSGAGEMASSETAGEQRAHLDGGRTQPPA